MLKFNQTRPAEGTLLLFTVSLRCKCSQFHVSNRELDFPQLNGSGHRDAAQTGDAPAPGVRDLGNESMSVTAVENAGDLGALPTRISDGFQMRRKPVEFQDNVFSTRVKNLRPGEVAQFFVATKDEVNRLVVRLRNVDPSLPPSQQNQLYGVDLFVRIADAPTSFFSGRVDEFVADATKFVIDEPQTGLVRVAIQGDWTNIGKISTDLIVERQHRTR
jgi:hypothetical protein